MISVTYAGAGGGKTYSMVKSVREKIKTLHPHRFICVITYTNNAAQDIKEELGKNIIIPSNVFVGTIHSFLLRFIIKPHLEDGGNFSPISELSSKKKLMGSFNDWAERKIKDPNKRAIAINNAWLRMKKEIYKKLIDAKLLTYDQIVQIAKNMVGKAKIRRAVSRKIQYLFVDEYQDTYKWQHDIFLQIHKCKLTELYVIGDPNQSIYNFAYGKSENDARRPKKYSDFPICQLKNNCDKYQVNKINHRSSKEIVDLANTFNLDFQQRSKMGNFTPIVAIGEKGHDEIYDKFHALRRDLKLKGTVFYLSKANTFLKPFAEKISLEDKSMKCIRSIEANIVQCVGMGIAEFCERNEITRFQFRTLSILCREMDDINIVIIQNKFKNKFDRELVFETHEVARGYPVVLDQASRERVLSIHKSKGLEAESVLFITNSNNHLNKLLTQKNIMKSATDDDLRQGYVAVTRAKKFLAIACNEKINQDNIDLLEKVSIGIV